MDKELHDKAWNLLEERGINLNERMMVRSHFASAYKNDYPFVSIRYKKGEIEYYHSDIEDIKNLMFETEREVILANAIYENVKEKFNTGDFIQMLKFTFRILDVTSRWC
ncbi:hypothetical protein M0Q97_09685 [Candidatus Dojkabacteria bacterium]|jgi:hypothetical protein|nr:hypothetical protein [Candidatus Dojkabacteria bacterium]